MKVVKKGHNEVGLVLERAGNSVLNLPDEDEVVEMASVLEPRQPITVQTEAPTLSDRLRELAALHRDGIISDEEFAAAKAAALEI